MKAKLFLALVVLLLTAVMAFAQQDSTLVGTWVHAEDGDIYVFNRNGTFTWEYDDQWTGTWTASNGILNFIYDDGFEYSCPYDFRNSTLYIDEDGPYRKR
jgi:hypothetical protein